MPNTKNKSFKKWLGLPQGELSLYEKIWLFAPIFIWFSYHPLIQVAQNETMNIELSLTLIYVVALAITSLPIILKNWNNIIKNKAVWLVGAFVLWSGLTILWDVNVSRGVLTFGVLGLLFLIFVGVIAECKKIKKLIPALAKILIVSALVMGVFALVQMVAGIWLGRNETLLCAGCVAGQFGFVRPNVFAIEPQFFGSLLLAPLLILLHKIITQKYDKKNSYSFIFLITILMLTLSRGAIFAFGLGAIVLFIIYFKQAIKRVMTSVGFMIIGLLISLIIQGTTASINPNFNETFFGAIGKTISQLSMNVINFLSSEDSKTTDNSNENVLQETNQIQEESEPAFDGYVTESTDVRVNLSRTAFATWRQDLPTMLFGVGLGGSGVAMADFTGNTGSREVVQNEYVEILLERGIIGVVSFICLIIGLLVISRQHKWLWAIIAAFLFQWLFFSGLPNALHAYLILMLIIIVYPNAKQNALVENKRKLFSIRVKKYSKYLAIAALLQAVLTIIGVVLLNSFSPNPNTEFTYWLDSPLKYMVNWDGYVYYNSLIGGYADLMSQSAVFYPLFSVLVYGLHIMTFTLIPVIWCGLIVNTLSLAAIIFLFRKIAEHLKIKAKYVYLFFFTFISVGFLNFFYTEAIFIAGSLLAYYLALTRKWIYMGIVLGLLTAVRIPAILIVGLCGLEFMRSYNYKLKNIFNRNLLVFLLAPAGFLAFGIHLYIVRGDFFAMFNMYTVPWTAWPFHQFNLNVVETLVNSMNSLVSAIVNHSEPLGAIAVRWGLPLYTLLILLTTSLYGIIKIKKWAIPLGIFGLASFVFFTINSNVYSVHRYILSSISIFFILSVVFSNAKRKGRIFLTVFAMANALAAVVIFCGFVLYYFTG